MSETGYFMPACFVITMTSSSLFLFWSASDVIFWAFQKGKALSGRRVGRDVMRKAAGRNSYFRFFAFRFLFLFYARAAKQSRFRRLAIPNVVFNCVIKVIKINKNKVDFKGRLEILAFKAKQPLLHVAAAMWRNRRQRGGRGPIEAGRTVKHSSKSSEPVDFSHFLVGDVNFALKRFFGPPEKLGGGGYLL